MSQLNDFIKGGALTADLSHGNKLRARQERDAEYKKARAACQFPGNCRMINLLKRKIRYQHFFAPPSGPKCNRFLEEIQNLINHARCARVQTAEEAELHILKIVVYGAASRVDWKRASFIASLFCTDIHFSSFRAQDEKCGSRA